MSTRWNFRTASQKISGESIGKHVPVARRLSCVIVLIAALAQLAMAQQASYKFRHLDISKGLSHHEITSIYKDSRGFIWIGTPYFGLNRYDGNTVKLFLHDAHDTTSLISNSVHRVFETPDRKVAVVTSGGFNLYDPEFERFERHPEAFYTKYGTTNEIKNIQHDGNGSYWFVEPNKIIYYSAHKDTTIVFQNAPNDTTTILSDPISESSIDPLGGLWIVHTNGIAEKIEVHNNQGQVQHRIRNVFLYNQGASLAYRILCDSDGHVWLNAPGLYQGVFLYTPEDGKIQHITTSSSGLRLNTNAISGFIEERKGSVWIGTDHGGINVIDKPTRTVRYILHRPEDRMSLSENSSKCFFKDDQGIVWIGTYKRGVDYYHKDIYRFDLFKRYTLDPSSLPFEDINCFAEDEHGNLWIGTNGGGLLYFDRSKGTFRQYLNEPGNENSLSTNVVVSLLLDSDKNLWIGTYNGGLNKFDGKRFTRYKPVPDDPTSIPSVNIWELFEDSKDRIWIGTLDGAAQLDRKSNTFHRLPVWQSNSLQSNIIDAMAEDKHGNIWFGTNNGIDVLSPAGNYTHFSASPGPNSLSSNDILDLTRDSKGRMWIATMDGLNLYDESINGFRVYKENLPHKAVFTVEEDNLGRIWMGSLNGLCEMTLVNDDPNHVTLQHYLESDGLQGLQFNLNSAFKTKSGELVFGGPTGFNLWRSEEPTEPLPEPRVVFSDLRISQKSVGIGEAIDGVVILDRAMAAAPKVILPPQRNSFSIRFSALDYFNPEKIQYMYKLSDTNTDWLPVEAKNHELVFTGLNPGHYVLHVKASTIDGQWSPHEAVLSITIQPPFWKTNIAFMIYALLLILILFVARRVIQQREKLKFELEHERREIQRVQELDMMKVKFFTNVSHEFRTPLTLILTPIERLLKKATDPDQVRQFQLIHRNGKRLLSLVSQLLDFKKLEVQEIKFTPSEGDVVSFVKDIVLSFSDLTEKKNIQLSFHSSVEQLNMLFDKDKLEKTLFNLLSNAFKFTLENGKVTVNLTVVKQDDASSLRIDVEDTGIGIPEDKVEKIFEPFFQNDLPTSMVNQGSGIGLSIAREFVRIHGGQISVKSEVGKGSVFTIVLPIQDAILPAAEETWSGNVSIVAEPGPAETQSVGSETETTDIEHRTRKKTLLLVEDNDDFRFYLKDNLKFTYTIVEARNGAEGWNKVLESEPDLVVSDVMMPEMNGIDLCAKIKSDERVSHIPVILLTARSSDEQRLEGYQTGANDYVTKPFNFEILEARITNLLKQREKSQRAFRKTLDVKASELQITPLDVKFVENAIKCVEKNVDSADFSVEYLGVELGISRAYVYKKIMALTGKSPLEFIRTIRLQHAAQLLEKSQLSVSEVAYKVGFNNPKYFTKYFKEQYHVLPSQYAASKKKEQSKD